MYSVNEYVCYSSYLVVPQSLFFLFFLFVVDMFLQLHRTFSILHTKLILKFFVAKILAHFHN